jgi:hypothetical protein
MIQGDQSMKRKYLFLVGALLVVVLAAGVAVGRTYATTGCFPDTGGHWAETFICWLKDNGISSGYPDLTYRPENNVTRAEMAVMLKNQANVPPANGLILVTAGYGNWSTIFYTDPIGFDNFSNVTWAIRTAIGSSYLSVQPDLPTVLYGRSLQLNGVEFCYGATADALLDYVEINTFRHTLGPNNRTVQFSDETDRTDTACKLYTLATPVVLTADDGVNFFILVKWTVASAKFEIGRTTFILQPTDTIAAPPAGAVTLGSSSLPGETGSTTSP